MPIPDDGRAAYVQFRLNNLRTLANVAGEIAEVEGQIAHLQAVLARQRAAAVLREQGLLFAWAKVRADAHRELAAVSRQPWFESLDYVAGESAEAQDRAPLDLPAWLLRPATPPAGQGLRLTARLQDGSRLCLWLRPAAWPMLQIELPSGLADGASALFYAALAALVAEGRLADVVAAVAQRFGLTLAAQADGKPRRIDEQADRHYFLQRAAWLMADGAPGDPELEDVEALVLRLGQLQRRLFILDEQRRKLKSAPADQGLVSQYEREWEALRNLPHVASLVIRGDRAQLVTDTIYIQEICVGSFRVDYDFSAKTMQIVNQSKPIYEDEVRFDHPHVRNGNPCLGNILKAVADFLANRDLLRLVDLTIDFLCSYNASNPHRRLEMWA